MENTTLKRTTLSHPVFVKALGIAVGVFAVLVFVGMFVILDYWYSSRDQHRYYGLGWGLPTIDTLILVVISAILPATFICLYIFKFSGDPKRSRIFSVASLVAIGVYYIYFLFVYWYFYTFRYTDIFWYPLALSAIIICVIFEFKRFSKRTTLVIFGILSGLTALFTILELAINGVYVYEIIYRPQTGITLFLIVLLFCIFVKSGVLSVSAEKKVWIVLRVIIVVCICYAIYAHYDRFPYTFDYGNDLLVLFCVKECSDAFSTTLLSIALAEMLIRTNGDYWPTDGASRFDPKSQLLSLKKLHDGGVLTDEEYEQKRSDIINKL